MKFPREFRRNEKVCRDEVQGNEKVARVACSSFDFRFRKLFHACNLLSQEFARQKLLNGGSSLIVRGCFHSLKVVDVR